MIGKSGMCWPSATGSSTRRAMVARWILLLVLTAATEGVLRVHGEKSPSSTGFISIDCGLPEKSSYVDSKTKLTYVSDVGFTDAGSNRNVSAEFINPSFSKRYLNVRSFPGAARSCYTIGSITPGSKYLFRATFMYGNYDGLSKLPVVFDLHLGVNFWKTVNITVPDYAEMAEVIAVVPADSVQVCLVNTGSGTPFISGLDVRPVKSTLYSQVNATQGLVLNTRRNFGTGEFVVIRYPDDPYDRVWSPWSDPVEWSEISTAEAVGGDLIEVPSAVMQTAIVPLLNASNKSIDFSWYAEPSHVYPDPGYICMLHFAELQRLDRKATRQFDVIVNGITWFHAYTPLYLTSDTLYSSRLHHGSNSYNISLKARANSTLPPIVNAFEIFSVISTANVATDVEDVAAIMAIKANYQMKKDWVGDPCVPKTLAWDGLSCSYAISSPPRIESVNLSFSGLSGDVSFYFAKLKALKYLDLSHNKLEGSIPDVLSQLPSLTVIDLTGNQLNGSIPPGLLKRIQDGSLSLRYGNNPNLCSNSNDCQSAKKKNNSMLAIYIAVPSVVFVVVGTLALLFLFMRVKGRVEPGNNLNMKNRRFTYNEVKTMTNNFQQELGKGGFGNVYDGFLKDGTHVAVKLLSECSKQGVGEFLTEAETLTKIHHKNIVSLIGYCKDGRYMALVYEYMPGGTLEHKLRGSDNGSTGSLTWKQRLHIALDSAQGLEYLHKSCSKRLIHRDVKTSNILLTDNLEAKIADFGLLKAFQRDEDTHVSKTRVVGTEGYFAPEYFGAQRLTEKCDVYSFGVVLLEVITGKPAILKCPEPTNIITWVRQRLNQQNIEDVVDPRILQDDYDVNVAWKAVDIALKCTERAPEQRPTMTGVVTQLQECLMLEDGGCRRYAI